MNLDFQHLQEKLSLFQRIGCALTSETDHQRLFDLIVYEARMFTRADAGSLYTLDGDHLIFEITQNETLKQQKNQQEVFKPFPLPLSVKSIAGYCGITGETLNIENVYDLPKTVPYSFNPTFDIKHHYTTRSMLVVPMKDTHGEILGVLQLINAMNESGNIIPFDASIEVMVESIASQAAVAIRNAKLVNELKAKQTELQNAFILINRSNEELKSLLKEKKTARSAGAIFLIGLLIISGFYFMKHNLINLFFSKVKTASSSKEIKQLKSFVVKKEPVFLKLMLTGKIEPLQIINVVSPFTGRILEKNIFYGQEVQNGDALMRIDTSELETRLMTVKMALIKAEQRYTELKEWESGNEFSRSVRSHTKAKSALESLKKRVEDTTRLFAKGIVPASELEGIKEQLQNQELDLKNAQDELESVKKKGSPKNIEAAQIELENARNQAQELEKRIENSTVRAVAEGVILRPKDEEKEPKTLEIGSTVNEGQILMAIGILIGMSVRTQVDEIDIGKLKIGQKVIVSGDAFSGVILDGKITGISYQAKQIQSGGTPFFEVIVIIPEVTSAIKQKVRPGMTASLEVEVYHKSDALTVPLEYIRKEHEKSIVTIKHPDTGNLEDIEVETGITTLTSIEIRKGLKSGDEAVTRK